MKQIKNFILMSVLLLMGSVCWAQETEVRDSLSIWDVTTNFTDQGTEIRFRTQPNMKGYWSFYFNFLDANGKKIRGYLIEGRSGEIFSKYSDVLYSVIENDSTALIVFNDSLLTLSFLSEKQISSLLIIKEYDRGDDYIVRRKFPMEIVGQYSNAIDVENNRNIEKKFYLLTGVEIEDAPYNEYYIESMYLGNVMIGSRKRIKR